MTLKFDRSYRKEFPSSARKSTASEGNYLRTKEQDNRYLDAVVCDENNETAAFLADRDHPTRCRSKKSEKAGLPSSSRIPDRNFLSTSCCVTSPVLVATTTEPASVAPTGGKGKSWRDILLQFLWRLTGSFRGVFEGRETDVDGVDVEKPTLHFVPSSIERLQSITRFSRDELKTLYRNFKTECPHGIVSEEKFKSIYRGLFPTGEAEMYAHYAFHAFAHRDEEIINFEELAVGLSLLQKGTLEEKLRWTFRLYDINHDGYITREEMAKIVESVHLMVVEPPLADESHLAHSEKIFNKFDRNGDGYVTFDEFYESCVNNQTIVQSMMVFHKEECDVDGSDETTIWHH
ncbi:A-type potassium channel modulatory protein KCNIP1-like isoform X1 [Clavelina lepadiformis]|uniref:A-type potassium channel modulatory protein KCNIP1-like isoform X1 n=1 Tax=Clavelina lepadiformis TaxID=159417 RepID=UPI0040431A23